MNDLNNCVLSESELEAVSGAADGCYYDGKLYSPGAKINMANGYIGTCSPMPGTVGMYYWT